MEFGVVLTNVLITLLYIVPGYALCKMKRASADHLSTLSAVLLYIGTPCLLISTFLQLDLTTKIIVDMGLFFGITFLLQTVFMALIWLIFRKKYEDAKYRILTVASIMGNVGFFGLPVIRSILPGVPEVLSYSAMYTVSMNIFSFTVGVFCLTRDRKYMSLKAAFCNPTLFGFALALPLYLTRAGSYLPSVLIQSIQTVADMTVSLCMIILGIRLATVSLKKLFTRPFVYLICLSKQLVFPLFCLAVVSLFPMEYPMKAALVILAGTPCASIILNLAEMYHSETELSANCVLLSTMSCFLTIPLLTLLL